MFSYVGNPETYSIIKLMVNEDFLRLYANRILVAFCTQLKKEDYELAEDYYVHGYENDVREILKSEFDDAEHVDYIMKKLYTIDEDEVVIHYYTFDNLSETERMLLTLYEEYVSSKIDTKLKLFECQGTAYMYCLNAIKAEPSNDYYKMMADKLYYSIMQTSKYKDKSYDFGKYANMIK